MGSAFRVPNPHPPGSPTLTAIPQRLVGQRDRGRQAPRVQISDPLGLLREQRLPGLGWGRGSMVGGERRGQHKDEVGTKHIRLSESGFGSGLSGRAGVPRASDPRLGRPSPGGSGGRRVWAAAAGPSILGWAEELGPRR